MRRLVIFLVLVGALAAGFAAAAQDPGASAEQISMSRRWLRRNPGKPRAWPIWWAVAPCPGATSHCVLVGLALVDFVGLVAKREAWQRAGIFVLAGTVLSCCNSRNRPFARGPHGVRCESTRLLVCTEAQLVVAGLLLVAFVSRLSAASMHGCAPGLWPLVFAATCGAGTADSAVDGVRP